jgi:hypothetical protein
MRPSPTWLLVVGVACLGGCKQPVTSPAETTAPHKNELGFRVKWPGKPDEIGPHDVGNDMWQYSAIYMDKERHLLYSASVTELGSASANMPARDRLAYFKAGLARHEVSRVEIEYGPMKLPGLEIYATAGGKDDRVKRGLVVASETRIYQVEVVGPDKAAMETQEVVAFLHSLVIDQ